MPPPAKGDTAQSLRGDCLDSVGLHKYGESNGPVTSVSQHRDASSFPIYDRAGTNCHLPGNPSRDLHSRSRGNANLCPNSRRDTDCAV